MQRTVTGTHRSGIGCVRKDNKLGMVRDDCELGDSLKGVATHDCGPDTRSEITMVDSATAIN